MTRNRIHISSIAIVATALLFMVVPLTSCHRLANRVSSTEAENSAKEQYGDELMLNFLRNSSYESARQVIATITEDVERHRNGAEPNDDLTMMCICIKNTTKQE